MYHCIEMNHGSYQESGQQCEQQMSSEQRQSLAELAQRIGDAKASSKYGKIEDLGQVQCGLVGALVTNHNRSIDKDESNEW